MYSLRDMGILGSESLAMERSSLRGAERLLRSLRSDRRVAVSSTVANGTGRRVGWGAVGRPGQLDLTILEMLDVMWLMEGTAVVEK